MAAVLLDVGFCPKVVSSICGQSTCRAFIVVGVPLPDGVGGWAESGVDPAIYSKRLCVLIDEHWQTGDDRYLASPKELLIDACKSNTEIGSCTICMVTLDENSPVIFTANLGDSGYMILRNDKTVRDDDLNIFYESKE